MTGISAGHRTGASPAAMQAERPPARCAWPTRMVLRSRYAWHNGSAPPVVVTRRAVDELAARRSRLLVSSGPAGTPTVGYAGYRVGHGNILSFLEGKRDGDAGTARRELHPSTWGAAADAPDQQPVDLLLLGCDRTAAAGLPVHRSLVLPFRVHLRVEVPSGVDELRANISKRERQQFSKGLRNHAWTLEQTADPAAFDQFYAQMHEPTMRQRHGDNARSESEAVAYECLLRSGRLFFVKEGDTRVTGALCRWDQATQTLTTRLLGVLNGDDGHYESGAFKAVYHLLLEWACANRIRYIDFHGTEAFLSKGIFTWKRRLSPKVVFPPNHFAAKRLWLHVVRDTPGVRDLLVANPTLVMTADGSFEAVFFYDREREARRDVSWHCAGIVGACELDLDEFLAGAPR